MPTTTPTTKTRPISRPGTESPAELAERAEALRYELAIADPARRPVLARLLADTTAARKRLQEEA